MASERPKTPSIRTLARSGGPLEWVDANVFVADKNLKVLSVNPAGQAALSEGELELETVLSSTDDLAGRVQAADADPYVTEIDCNDQTWELSFKSVRDAAGRLTGYVVTWRDCTEEARRNDQFNDFAGQIDAIGKSLAVIHFEMDGTILWANDKFLKTMGYALDEIVGKHHRMFVDDQTAQSDEYSDFWARLNHGDFETGEYKRFAKGGKEVWLQSAYNAILDRSGKPFKVVKYAIDITCEKFRNADFEGQIEAIGNSQAVIEFDMDGTIKHANDRFLEAMGYSLDEIVGQHHRMFVDAETAQSEAYRDFWETLNRGDYVSGEYKRFTKNGDEVWLQASYTPIRDLNGQPFKVVKYASDVTAQVKSREYLTHILGTVTGSADSLASASDDLTQVSHQMGANAEETSAQANVVASAAEQVGTNVTTVATGIEELTASIGEIASNAGTGAQVTENAVAVVETANGTISKLGDSSTEIGNVIKVITSIAEQTNLLALNATIEAARAGEAGKGFAVVANEVKELAKETARATEDISHKIEAIQCDTRDAIKAIEEISGIINKVNDIQVTIAAAVEEQTATTSEMSRSVSEAASGSMEIARNIAGVADAARHTTSGADNSQKSAGELARMASELQSLVLNFKRTSASGDEQNDPPKSPAPSASELEQLIGALRGLVQRN